MNTDSRKNIQLRGNLSSRVSKDNSYYRRIGLSFVLRPSSSIKITLSADQERILNHQQWVSNVSDSTVPYEDHYVFSDIDQSLISAAMRIDWGITQKLSLQAYFQPLLAAGDYSNFKELARAKTHDFYPYLFDEFNPDFNVKSLKGNIVLRWEYLPGSILYLVLTHSRTNLDRPGEFNFGHDLRTLLNEDGKNIFLIKVSYLLNVY